MIHQHNAYNINEEGAALKKVLDDWCNDQSVQQKIEEAQRKLAGVAMSKQLARQLAFGSVSTADEYAAAETVINEISKKERALDRQIAELKKKLPPHDIQRKMDNYLKQLESDNYLSKLGLMFSSDVRVKRIDGLNFLITSTKTNFRVKKTYYYDNEANSIESKYIVLEK